jgi:hypothetical protein
MMSFEDFRKEEELFEMAKIRPERSGLSGNLSVWVREESNEHGHSKYRVKIYRKNEHVASFLVKNKFNKIEPLSLPKINISTQEEKEVSNFLMKNQKAIIELIDGEIDFVELANTLKKI